MNLLKRMRKERGISVILITHDLALVSEIADKVAIMYAGQIVELGSAKDIYANPMHPYTKALIAATPSIKSREKKINFIPGNPPSLCNPEVGCYDPNQNWLCILLALHKIR
jgi:peptide/nickel transport system ATP-binding protein